MGSCRDCNKRETEGAQEGYHCQACGADVCIHHTTYMALSYTPPITVCSSCRSVVEKLESEKSVGRDAPLEEFCALIRVTKVALELKNG